MAMKLEVKRSILNIVNMYAPQVNNSMEEKNDFWEDLDGLIESVSKKERIVLDADLNGHVGKGNIGDEDIMGYNGMYGARTRNKEGSMVVDFGKRMDLAIVNTYFKKEDKHKVTYKSDRKSTQVDYVFYFYFYLYIYPPNAQESGGSAIHRVSNYPNLLLKIPRYCCPLVI